MRKKSSHLQNRTDESGFVFPFVLFLTTVLILALTYTITIYETTVQISHYHEQNIIFDSLYQMAEQQTKTELQMNGLSDIPASLIYTFPSGKVYLSVIKKTDNILEYKYELELPSGETRKGTSAIVNEIPAT